MLRNHRKSTGRGRDHDNTKDHGEEPRHTDGGDGVGAKATDNEDVGDPYERVDLRRQRHRYSDG